MPVIDSLRAGFFEECEDLLARMGDGLGQLSEAGQATEAETIHDVFRAVHSIKGGAAAFGLTTLVSFAHAFESVLDLMRAGRMEVSAPGSHTLLRAYDVLCDLVAVARDGGAEPAQTDQLVGELDLLAESGGGGLDEAEGFGFAPVALDHFADLPPGGEPPGGGGSPPGSSGQDPRAPATSAYHIAFEPSADLYAHGHEPAALLRSLAKLGEGRIEADPAAVPVLAALDPDRPALRWTMTLHTAAPREDIKQVFEAVEHLALVAIRLLGAASPDLGTPPQALPGVAPEPHRAGWQHPPAPAGHAPESQPPSVPAPPAPLQPAAVAPSGPAAAPAAGATHPPVPATIRVNLDRVDRLMNQIGEIAIMEAMLSQAIGNDGLGNDIDIKGSLDGIRQLAASIRESVMAIRAQPLKSVFQRMERITREAAGTTGKLVRLVTLGEATEVDKTVIERLVDPLTHMIRNSVDHGIEPAAAREAAGKPAEGLITLSAAHRSGRVIIAVGDDGRGINRTRVRELAEAGGLIAPGARLSPADIDNLLFLPGFSSKQQVSALSGRGVGLDVVRREVQALGGRVNIQSVPGQGTTFTIALPLTPAVLEGMLIGVGDQTMVLPLSSIIETLRPSASQIHLLGPTGPVIVSRDELIPIVDLARSFGFPAAGNREGSVLILVETDSGRRAALAVDRIHDQRQVVIKSLKDNFGNVPGIAAATILGDGRIALIVDPEEVLGRAAIDGPTHSLAANG